MKKILITIVIASAAVLSSHAQGLVFFSSSTQNMSTNSIGTIGRTSGANNFYYALFVSTATTVGGSQTGAIQGTNGVLASSDAAHWTFAGMGDSTATAGRFAALVQNADTSSTLPSGFAGGNAYQFVVMGWSANLGSSLSALHTSLSTPGTAGFLGQSAVSGNITTGNGALIGTPNLFGGVAPSIQAFTLGNFTVPPIVVVPEPTTLALAGLSGASLLLFRRRK